MRSWWPLCLVLGLCVISAHAQTARRRAVTPPVRQPSSATLIDRALAAGTITAEQALTYAVFADFGDPRLPAAFRGDDSGVTEADSPGLAAAQWASLSQATRDAIGPYLVPPFYEGSWWDQRRVGPSAVVPHGAGCRPWESASCFTLSDWKFVAGDHVRVWYDTAQPDDFTRASDLVLEADIIIWPELIRIMGREPIVDHTIDGKNLLDIVLVDNLAPGVLATTFPWEFQWNGCKKGPTYVAVSHSAPNKFEFKSAFAHELFHSVQHAFDTIGCHESNYKWLMESTATWFEDELYKTVDREHAFADDYLQFLQYSMATESDLFGSDGKRRNYGKYTFFFYLTRVAGADPTRVVRSVWEAAEKNDARGALDTGLKNAGMPLEKAWPGFAVYSWNEAAPYNQYDTVDRLKSKATFQKEGSITVPDGDINVRLSLPNSMIPDLSIDYYRFDFDDATASSVIFYNGIQRALNTVPVSWIANFGTILSAQEVNDPASIKGAHVDALLKINGKWSHEDWTGLPFKSYCRDAAKERLESLVIILSNSSIDNNLMAQGKYPPILQASNIGCYAWEGKADLTFIDPSGQKDRITVNNLVLKASGDVPEDNNTPLRRKFDVANGTFDWSVSGASTNCGYSAAPIGNAQAADGFSFLFTFPYASSTAAASRGIFPELLFSWLSPQMIVKKTCTTGSGTVDEQVMWNAPEFVLITKPDDPGAQFTRDGKSLTIDVSKLKHSIGGKALSGSWTFLAVRE